MANSEDSDQYIYRSEKSQLWPGAFTVRAASSEGERDRKLRRCPSTLAFSTPRVQLTYSVLSPKPGSNQASERSPKERIKLNDAGLRIRGVWRLAWICVMRHR
jgi:hypothetical protein